MTVTDERSIDPDDLAAGGVHWAGAASPK